MNTPLVTVICVCYNQARFVAEALDSVINQTYANIELIVIDDGSTDGSVKIMKQWMVKHPQVTLLLNAKNSGYCKTFNRAFALAKGTYCIDLAADDLLLPTRVEEGVTLFEEAGDACGIIFSDAQHITEEGNLLEVHSARYPHHSIPQGDVYQELIEHYFICPTSMMFRSTALNSVRGYDESLSFEDFDLWIRIARNYLFRYSPSVLVKKRDVSNSMSKQQFIKSSAQRWSTLEVCKKIKMLNQNSKENDALKRRLWYEIRTSLRLFDFKLALAFWNLKNTIE